MSNLSSYVLLSLNKFHSIGASLLLMAFSLQLLLRAFFASKPKHQPSPLTSPPSPRLKLPILGNLLTISWAAYMHDWYLAKGLVSLCEKHEGITLVYIGELPCLLLSRIEDMRAILGKPVSANRPDVGLLAVQKRISQGLAFQDYGNTLHKVKHLLYSVFTSKKAVLAFEEMFKHAVLDFCTHCAGSESVRIGYLLDDIMGFLFHVAMIYFFGKGMASNKAFGAKLFEACESQIHAGLDILFSPGPEDLFPTLFRFFPKWILQRTVFFPYYNKVKTYEDICKKTKPYFEESVQVAHRNYVDGTLDQKSVMYKLLSNSNKEFKDMNFPDVVRDVLTGAYHAPGYVYGTLINILVACPDVLQKLQKEVRSIKTAEDGYVSSDDLSRLPYLKAVYYETHRYIVLVGNGFPHCFGQDFEYNGFKIQKGTMLMALNQGPMHDAQVFESPELFNPSRWIDSSDGSFTMKSGLHDSWVPFGVGLRKCPGTQFTEIIFSVLVANLVRNLDFELADSEIFQGICTGHIVLDPVRYKFKFSRARKQD